MKKICMGFMALAMTTTVLAEGKYGFGFGVGYHNSIYRGVDEEWRAIPLLDVEVGNFYIKGAQPGYFLLRGNGTSLSVFVDPFAGFPVDEGDLDRDYQVMGGLRADTSFFGLRQGASIQMGKHGIEGRLSLYQNYDLGEAFSLTPGIHIKGYDQEYSDYYFGTKDYNAESAFSYGATMTAEYKIQENFSLLGILALEHFSDEIKDSPLTKRSGLFLTTLGMKYYF